MQVLSPSDWAEIIQLTFALFGMMLVLVIAWGGARYFFQRELEESRKKLERKRQEILKTLNKQEWEE